MIKYLSIMLLLGSSFIVHSMESDACLEENTKHINLYHTLKAGIKLQNIAPLMIRDIMASEDRCVIMKMATEERAWLYAQVKNVINQSKEEPFFSLTNLNTGRSAATSAHVSLMILEEGTPAETSTSEYTEARNKIDEIFEKQLAIIRRSVRPEVIEVMPCFNSFWIKGGMSF